MKRTNSLKHSNLVERKEKDKQKMTLSSNLQSQKAPLSRTRGTSGQAEEIVHKLDTGITLFLKGV